MITPLPAWALFGAVLSAAGLPIYIFAPKFYADSHGVSLASLGALLFALRLVDLLQDPAFGWLTERLRQGRAAAVALAGLAMALAMLGLFAVPPPIAPIWWFAITVTALFSAFSFLSITFYAQGVARAATLPGGHVRLAAWRETGALLGICAAAVAPTLLTGAVAAPYAGFAWGFAAAALLAVWAMRRAWGAQGAVPPAPIRAILSDRPARMLLLLALVNAAPLAVTSTLFLFFVDDRLGAPGWSGPLLVLFFLSAALSAPVWGWLARHHGEKPVLLVAMLAAVASFALALGLGRGDVALFAGICIASGATIGADLTLLPALFACRMARIAPNAGQGFGLWALVNKLTLAIAAAVVLPLLGAAGLGADAAQPESALRLLGWLYAGLPLVLKLAAIGLLLAQQLPVDLEAREPARH